MQELNFHCKLYSKFVVFYLQKTYLTVFYSKSTYNVMLNQQFVTVYGQVTS